MRSIIRFTYTATLVLGPTLVYALPHNADRMIERAYSYSDVTVVYGGPDPTPQPTPAADQAATLTTTPQAQVADTSSPPQPDDTVTQQTTNTWSVSTTSGSAPSPGGGAFSALDVSPTPSSTSSAVAEHGTLAPAPTVASSHALSGHGVLTGVVVGGLILGLLLLTAGLWFCYRRRGPTSGASTPKYTTTVVGDEKPRSAFAFLRGRSMPWKKSHVRVRSSMSFASPILENEPKMVESNTSSVRSPLAPHLSGSTATRGDWNNHGRWSTFSTSDGSVYPQTPVGGGPLSGVIMETVVETDAASDPRTPTIASRSDIDYLDMIRSSNERIPPPLPALITNSNGGPSPARSNRLSDGPPTPSTYSSGGLTYGSVGHGSHYIRASNGITQQPILPTHFNNGSNPKFMSHNTTPLLSSKPKFDPTTRHSGSDTASLGQESGETIKITNPFLDDEEDGISSYGHGVLEADDRRSIRTMDSDAHGAYPSSAGCLDPKVSPSPSPDAPITRPRSSLISDSSSDYPYPLGYAIDSDGNVANPFLRISEILEEVDGRMRWPSPPLLPRAESRNY